MKKWITSDLHLGHRNIKKFCPESRARFSNDPAIMNQQMRDEWNALIGLDDTVYILGDVAFLNPKEACEIVNQLNGYKILIEGNHDFKLLQNFEFRCCFDEVHSYLEIKHDDHRIIMSHYPFLSWNQDGRGSIMLHGHLHGTPTGMERYRIRDMGMDATGKIAISLDDAIASALTGNSKQY